MGVVHRDLKPSNVLLAADGPKVIDFGISRPSDSELRTETGQLIGTPPFMAPEQFQRPRAVGPAADVFALGSLLVHASTGRGPFESESPYIVAYQVVHDEADLAGVPDELLPLIQRCLAKNPEDRPTPDALMTVLRAVRGPHPPAPRGPVPLVPQQRTPEPHSLPGGRGEQVGGVTDTHVKAGSEPARRLMKDTKAEPEPVADEPESVPGGLVADGSVADGSVADGSVAYGPVADGPVADRPVAGESRADRPVVRRRGIRRWALSGLAALVLLGAGALVALRPFGDADASGGRQPRNSAATAEAWRPWTTGLDVGKAAGSGCGPRSARTERARCTALGAVSRPPGSIRTTAGWSGPGRPRRGARATARRSPLPCSPAVWCGRSPRTVSGCGRSTPRPTTSAGAARCPITTAGSTPRATPCCWPRRTARSRR
ncbi:hypothetical protein SANT12839_053630 [Streptomyces antimycoticus]|uniref:non-specific serine/threonine protein kinase n=1 Tax=Streptomyces antimycoticus TaxID=68175 RepID=A0A4D4K5U1_9ACTN|nr:hypothetical protein SANT12839_053630 [Streptomyces antimycoticus]